MENSADTEDWAELTLAELGWRSVFAAEPAPETGAVPARVMMQHRGRLVVAGENYCGSVPLTGRAADFDVTVGDWVWLDSERSRVLRVFERVGVFRRGAAGIESNVQTVAANVDTLFIVTSANRDFNVARLERYLSVASEANAYPLVVLTKADTVADVSQYVRQAAQLKPGLMVEALDARDAAAVCVLADYVGNGQTVALVGSSGVGKSTLVNSLTRAELATGGVRMNDQRGRHTTTHRSMHRLGGGGWLIDTPGMRELKLVDTRAGIEDVFSEVLALAEQCRFSDCEHREEPGCAVLAAVAEGSLARERLERYRKLVDEDRRNSETLVARRARDRSQGRLFKSIKADLRRRKGS